MKRKTTLLALLLFLTVAALAPDRDARHFALSKSVPAADATAASPEEVRLWFTELPQANSTSIRLVGVGDVLIETGDVKQDADDGKAFSVAMEAPLAAGTYTVAWRAIGEDGHVVRGDFTFSVAVQ